jgi:GWxTD domain-containing protein
MQKIKSHFLGIHTLIDIVLLFVLFGSAVAQSDEETRDSLFTTGDAQFRRGNFKAAEDIYKKILKIDAYDTLALQRLGRIAYIDEDWGKTKDYFGKILEKYKSNSWALYYRGIAFRESGKYKALLLRKLDWDKSRNHFKTIIDQDSLFSDVLYQYAILLRFREKYKQALAMAHRQIRLKPELTIPQVKIFRMYRYFITHRDEKAVRDWSEEQGTDHALYAVGEAWRRQGKLDKADSLFREMLTNSAQISTSPLWLSRVKIYIEQEKFIQADSCFGEAVNKISNQIDADLIMEDLKYLLKEKEWLLYLNLDKLSALKVFIKKFWMRRNPLPASTWNVRLIEHYKRLIYSDKNYEYDGFKGWFMDPDPLSYLEYPLTRKLNNEYNDKGLIYIRHGEPNERAVTVGADIPVNESWLYYQTPFHPPLTFHFIAGKPGNDWRFAPYLIDKAILEDRLTWGNIYFQMLLFPMPLAVTGIVGGMI